MRLWQLRGRTPTGGVEHEIGADAIICADPAIGEVWGIWTRASILDARWERWLEAPELRSARIVVSTRQGEREGADRWRMWGREGRRLLDEACERLRGSASRAGAEFVLVPTADGVLSDVPSAGSFVRGHEGGEFGVLLEPAAMLTGQMLSASEDHVRRMVRFAAETAAVRGVVISSVRGAAGGGVECCGVEEGEIDAGVLGSILAESAGELEDRMCVVRGDAGRIRARLERPDTGGR